VNQDELSYDPRNVSLRIDSHMSKRLFFLFHVSLFHNIISKVDLK